MSGGGVTVGAVPPPTGFSVGGSSTVVMSGYAPDSSVGAFLFSDPVSLGKLAVGTDGSARGKIMIPANISPDQHTLQFTGWNAKGEPVILSASITVKPQVKRITGIVEFPKGSARPGSAGRSAMTRLVAGSAALTGPVTTVVTYPKTGTPAQVRIAKAQAQAVAKGLRERRMPGSIRIGAASRADAQLLTSGKVRVVATG